MISSIGEMIQRMEEGVYDYTEGGECSNCGECCTDILPVTKEELARIKRYVLKHGIKEHKHNYPMISPPVDLTCPFRNDKEKKCDIYEARPAICREFRCDKPSKGERSKLEAGNRFVVSMRRTFYGGKK